MPEPQATITRHDLIRMIGDVLTEIDVLSSHFDPDTEDRNRFDRQRENLDAAQRKLVRNAVSENSKQFKELTAPLKTVNDTLHQSIRDVGNTAASFESIVKFVGVVQKIAELVP